MKFSEIKSDSYYIHGDRRYKKEYNDKRFPDDTPVEYDGMYMVNYRLAMSRSRVEFEKECDSIIHEGFVPTGGVSFSEGYFLQAFVIHGSD